MPYPKLQARIIKIITRFLCARLHCLNRQEIAVRHQNPAKIRVKTFRFHPSLINLGSPRDREDEPTKFTLRIQFYEVNDLITLSFHHDSRTMFYETKS